MRTRMKSLLTAVILVSALMLVGNAFAAPDWFICEVIQTGQGGSTTLIQLTATYSSGGSALFVAKWFQASSTIRKEILATALTAKANNMPVTVYVDPAVGTQPVIATFYLR